MGTGTIEWAAEQASEVGLVIDTYFDNGRRIADSFTIQWNENIKEFEGVNFF
jgi:hypothetical protein